MNEQTKSRNPMQAFGQLPSGVQRVIIAVLVVLLLVGLMFVRQLIATEESVRVAEEDLGAGS